MYKWEISQKWVEEISQFNEDFIKSYNDNSDEEYFLEGDAQYLENLDSLHNDLPFLSQRMKIEKVEKHIANLHDKKGYVIHIRNSKPSLKSWISIDKSA